MGVGMGSGFDAVPIGDSFAMEIRGLELWRALEEDTIEAIRQVWSSAGVVVFRRQSLSEAEFADFSDRFGEIIVHVRADWQSSNHKAVLVLSNLRDANGAEIGGLGTGELDWHSDQSYQAEPATGSLLHGVEIPATGGATYFANLRLAHAALPDPIKTRIEGRDAIFSYVKRASSYDGEQPSAEALRAMAPDVVHPLVNRHPVTGAAALYLDPAAMAGIAGMADDEADALLEQIIGHATEPRFVYRHAWQPGDVLLWDNGLVLHRRDAVEASHPRLMKRTTLRLPADRHIVPPGALYQGG